MNSTKTHSKGRKYIDTNLLIAYSTNTYSYRSYERRTASASSAPDRPITSGLPRWLVASRVFSQHLGLGLLPGTRDSYTTHTRTPLGSGKGLFAPGVLFRASQSLISNTILHHDVSQSAIQRLTRLLSEPFGDEPACKPDFV